MADTTNLSKEEELLLSGVTNNSLRTSILFIREAAEKAWAEDVPKIIQDYTDHGIKHSQRVAGYAVQLLGGNRDKGRNRTLDLSTEEMYLLMAGIYLHDIGMQRDVIQIPDGQEIKNLAEQLGAHFDIKFTARSANAYSIDEQKAIRKNHQYLSAAWIEYAYTTNKTLLGLAAQTIPEGLVGDLMDVCKYHTKLPINECPIEFEFDRTQRKQLVAALLRFSDELDITARRVSSIEVVKNFSLDPHNSLYWWLHTRMIVVFPTPNMISLTIRLHPNDVERYGSLVEDEFIDEFLKKNGPVLDILGKNNIPLVISYDSKVVADRLAKPLPSEIVQALQEVQMNLRREVEVVTNIELAVQESKSTGSQTGDEAHSDTRIREILESARELAKSPQQFAGTKVLWIEDSSSNNLNERGALAALGIQFTISSSTEDTLEKTRSNSYDVIIFDVKLPGNEQTANTLLEELRKRSISTPVIIYAGSNHSDYMSESIKLGGFGATSIPQELFRLVTDAIKYRKTPLDRTQRLTANELRDLEAWNFTKDYPKHRSELVDLARTVYIATYETLSVPPTKDQFYSVFRQSLSMTELYRKNIAGRKAHLPPSLYDHFARLLANLVIEKNWNEITR